MRAEGADAEADVFLPTILLATAALLVLGLILLDRLGGCTMRYVCGLLLADDVAQTRLDTGLPAPRPDFYLEQTFVARRNGLTEIGLLLVRHGDPPPERQAVLTLELWDDAGQRVAAQAVPTRDARHNQEQLLRFVPQRASAGRVYTLRLLGDDDNQLSAWGYSFDVYEPGALTLVTTSSGAVAPQTTAADLRFVTRYALTAGDAAAAVARPLAQEGELLLAALLFLPLPGCLLLLLVRPRGWDIAVWMGAALALGVAAWPVIWLWVSLAGGRWSGPVLWAAAAVGWVVVLAWAIIGRRRRAFAPTSPPATHARLIHILLALLLIASVAARFIAVRDLAFPPWVDSSRHALITAVMVEKGRVLDDYEPYLPVAHFPYHFGFHTLSASLVLMTGRPLPGLLLYLGQLLNGLLPLTVYAAGWMVTRRRAVGLVAAFLVALPFFFPGYYATWGRLTQLSAMVVMPVLLALTWRLERGWPRYWPLVGVLAAGLFLLHFRVFLFYLPFAALAAAAHLIRYRRLWALAQAGGVALLLVLPRLVRLLVETDPLQTVGDSLPGYNDFPIGYVTAGWERVYLALAAVAVGLLVVGVARRRRWTAFPALLVVWVGSLFVLLAGDRLGLPETLVVNLNSMYITLFLPLALLLAIVAGRVWRAIDRWTRALAGRPAMTPWRALLAVITGCALGALALFGARQQVNILNRETILALPADVAALAWVDANLPGDAYIAVNAWQWLGNTWAGSDGGAWIVPLTGRAATTPPVDHIYNADLFAQVRAFNERGFAVEDWGDPAAADWLRAQGVTHVFVGQRGGYFDPAELSRNPSLELVYRGGGAFVFALTAAP